MTATVDVTVPLLVVDVLPLLVVDAITPLGKMIDATVTMTDVTEIGPAVLTTVTEISGTTAIDAMTTGTDARMTETDARMIATMEQMVMTGKVGSLDHHLYRIYTDLDSSLGPTHFCS